MTAQPRSPAGIVQRLRCNGCGAAFPNFVITGDTDMDTNGLVAGAICGEDAVVVAEARPAEWSESANGSHALIEARLSAAIGRSVKVLRLVRVAEMEMPKGLTLQKFREAWRDPECFYECACCEQGESHVVETLDVEAFQAAGGRVHLHL